MKKNTLIMLLLGFSFLMSAKCLEFFDPNNGFLAGLKDVTVTPKVKVKPNPVKGVSQSRNVLAPSNDACSGAIAITSLPYSFEQTDGATATNNDDFIDVCDDDGMNDGLWFTVIGDGGILKISVSPEEDFDPQLGLYSGSCDALECVNTVDDNGDGDAETIVVNSVQGTTYYINVGHYNSTVDYPEGNFTIEVESIAPLANDDCASATPITTFPYAYFQGDGYLSTNNEGMILTCEDGMNDGLWYTVEGDGNFIIINVAPLEDGEFDPKIGVFSGTCDAMDCVGSVDDTGEGGAETFIIENSVVGTTYYINIGYYDDFFDDPEGNFTINVQSVPLPESVPDCASNPYPADAAVDVPVGDVVFTWTAPTTGGPVDSYDFYGGTETPLTEDDFIGNYTETSADISISGYELLLYWKVVPRNLAGEAEGCTEWSFTTVAAPPTPANDECSTATAITTFPFTDELDAAGTTNNDGVITACNDGMNDGIWYTVIGNGSDITINATSGDWDAQLAVYTGSCGEFTCYDTVDDAIEEQTETITIADSEEGMTYYINFGQYNGFFDEDEGFTSIEVTTTALGVEGNDFKNFRSYPNPVKDILNLSYSKNITNVAVFNLLGQQVIAKAVNTNQSMVDMSALSSGTYMVKVTADNTVKTIKVIKQ